ncbi:Beta-catenin-like protein 1, partial [Dissostichus eleginoides]
EKKMSRCSSMKVLDHGMIGAEGADNCHKFVDILGLRTIFPLFMKTPKKMKKSVSSEKEHEEHVCSIIASMLRNLKSQQRSRLLNKFTENDCEKVDRLMEMHFKYLEAVQQADKRIEGEKHADGCYVTCVRTYSHSVIQGLHRKRLQLCLAVLAMSKTGKDLHAMVRRGEILDDGIEDDFYIRRLDAGLFVLQLICYIMVEISNSGIAQLQQRVQQILNLRGGSVKVVRHIMREYAESIGDGKSEEFKEAERKRIMDLVENF